MIEFVHQILDMDRFTLAVAIGGALLASYSVGAVMGSQFVTIFAAPIMVISSLLSVYLVIEMGYLVISGVKSADSVLATGGGVIIGFFVFMILMAVMTALSDAMTPKKKG